MSTVWHPEGGSGGLPSDMLDSQKIGERRLKVSGDDAKTAFGELQVANLNPVTQISAQYGLLTNVLTVADDLASGTNSVVDEMYTCQTGASVDGLASILTLRQLAYRAGQGALARFTALFTDGVALCNQAAGLITAENVFAFGFIGTNFGIIYARDGHDELQELTLTVAAGGAENATVTVDGTGYTVALSGLGTTQEDAFEIATSLNSQIANYNFSSNENQVVAQAVLSMTQGSFAYTSSTSTGAWVQLLAGEEADIDFISQSNWNMDTRISADSDINLDPTMGNVYQIQFQYLGFGAINFFVEDKGSGDLVLVHRIKFGNSSMLTSVNNPTFRIGWVARNTGNNTNVIVRGGSAAGFIEGPIFRDTPSRSITNDQLSIGSTQTNIVSIRNRFTFSNKVNRAEVFPLIIAGSTQANKFALFKIIVDPVYSAPVIFSYVDKVSSLVEVATDSVGVTGGTEIGAVLIVAGPSLVTKFNDILNTVTALYPNSTFAITAEIPTGAAADCQVALTWQEDL